MDSRSMAEQRIAADVRRQIEATGQYNPREGDLEYHGADCAYFTRCAIAAMAASNCSSTTMTLLRDLRNDLIEKITNAEIKACAADLAADIDEERAARLERLSDIARYGVAYGVAV
jgi:hypothetical protein